MKHALSIVALAMALFGASPLAAQQIGEPAPGFVGTTDTGEMVSLSELKGKTVVLEWTNDGCPYVQKHYEKGNMQRLQKRAKADGVVWLSVISSGPGQQGHVTRARARELTASRKAAPAHVILDPKGNIGRLYGAKTTPHMYVIDEDGILRYNGAIDSIPSTDTADIRRADNYVLSTLDALKEGRRPVVQQSRAYGCSVKYAN